MNSFWKINGGAQDTVSSVRGDKVLSPEEAESILSGLASTYSKEKDIEGSLGAFHHFF
jgi:hypothetical protein